MAGWRFGGAVALAVSATGALLSLPASGAEPAPPAALARATQALQRGDVVAAMTLLRPLVAAGDARAMSMLGFVLEQAGAVDEAARLYEQAAARDDAEGHLGLAQALAAGRGVAKDEKKAYLHFSKAAALGNAHAVELVAAAWLGRQWGLDAQADPAAARQALLLAATQGHLPSAEALRAAYAEGRLGLAPDAGEAERWQTRIAAWKHQRRGAAGAAGAGAAGASR